MVFFSKILGDPHQGALNKLQPIVEKINSLEPEVGKISSDEFRKKSQEFKERLSKGESLDDILPEAFALCREAAKRTLNQRHFDVQLIGGIVLHQGKIAEMKTGEGKTLAATLPVYLNALEGKGVHVVTVNDYLAKRDMVWMGQIYHFLGLTVGCIAHDSSYIYDPEYQPKNPKSEILNSKQIPNPKSQSNPNGQNPNPIDGKRDEERDLVGGFKVVESYLRPVARKEAYAADITYGTNNEFGFDYLRDNLVYRLEDQAQRGFNYAIVDEVDSILIDEARTPLIISFPDQESGKLYEQFAKIVPQLKENVDYNVDEKMRAVSLSEEGIQKIEKIFGLGNIWVEGGIRYVHHLEQALRAQVLFQRDKDYVVKNEEVIIVDEFTGRMLPGRRYSDGLHQAIEAKEGVRVQQESRTLATITFQNYFRMYKKLAGMTGTAATNAEEFHKVYKLDVMIIPTNKIMIRKDLSDLVFRTSKGKFEAVTREIKKRYEAGQPVLVGTVSIEKNELLSKYLEREGVPHKVLNAKHHEEEGAIIAQAGKLGAVTVATNMAGRGVDIVLGGNPPDADEARKAREAGGLHIIGTERHEARRIDNQLRGRSGRQGDPGSSQFCVSLEDDVMRIFGGDKIKSLMANLGIPEDQPIENRIISGALESAQAKIEGYNFDIRKHVLEYDEVLNKHREKVYGTRREILQLENPKSEILNSKQIPNPSPAKILSRQNLGGQESQIPNSKLQIQNFIEDEIAKIVDFHTRAENPGDWNVEEIFEAIKAIFPVPDGLHQELSEKTKSYNTDEARQDIKNYLLDLARKAYEEKEKQFGEEAMRQVEKIILLQTLDTLWMEHLENMEYLRDSVRLRAYGQRDPLVEYKTEGHRMFQRLLDYFQSGVVNAIFKVVPANSQQPKVASQQLTTNDFSGGTGHKEVGRNDPCPCGSGKKYKRCHGSWAK